MNPETLRDLKARVEAAAGPDRMLDAMISQAEAQEEDR